MPVQVSHHRTIISDEINVSIWSADCARKGEVIPALISTVKAIVFPFNDEMIVYEMDHIWTADMKSSEAMILAVMIRSSYMIHFIYHFIVDSFLTGTLEPTNGRLPTSVASQLSWLERCTGIMRSQVQTLLKSWIFQSSLSNCKNCVHNCEDHSFTCLSFIKSFHSNKWDQQILTRSQLSGFIVQLQKSWVGMPLKLPEFFKCL